MKKVNWFWKTLRGYKVVFVNVDHTYSITHRPFRQPIMECSPSFRGLRGRSYNVIYFDEYVDNNELKKEK